MNVPVFVKRSIGFVLLAAVLAVVALPLARPSLLTKQCLLLFGPEANLAVSVELRDNQLLLHGGRAPGSNPQRYSFANGLLPTNAAPQIIDTNRGIRYTITGASRLRSTSPRYDSLLISIRIEEGNHAIYEQYADAQLRPGWKPAAVAHFHGPLTIGPQTVAWELPSYVELVRGTKTNDLRSYIGTMDPKRACWTVVKVHRDTNFLFPDGVFPFAEIEFPPLEPHQPPPKAIVPLQEFC